MEAEYCQVLCAFLTRNAIQAELMESFLAATLDYAIKRTSTLGFYFERAILDKDIGISILSFRCVL